MPFYSRLNCDYLVGDQIVYFFLVFGGVLQNGTIALHLQLPDYYYNGDSLKVQIKSCKGRDGLEFVRKVI